MNYNKFFELAKEAGIEESELYIGKSYSLSFSLFHGEIDNYTSSESISVLARGKYKGKMGSTACEILTKDTFPYLIKQIKETASVIESKDPIIIFKGSEKYHKINTFNKVLPTIPVKTKLDNLFELEKKIKSLDKRICEVGEVGFEESSSETILMNSYGLKLKQKTNMFYYYGEAIASDGEQKKSGFKLFLNNDYSKFDVDKLAKDLVEETVEQLNGISIDSGEYKVFLTPKATKSLLNAYMSSADAEEVQKKSSLFIGKLDQKVASSKVTIEDKPIQRTVFAKWFDDEGVATSNKPIVKNGVLKTYLYNLTTAAKDNTVSTGNAVRGNGKIYTAPNFLYMKPGNKTNDELYKEINNGVIISDFSGLHSGLNPQSGNFSLQSTGFIIKDGKKDKPLDIIVVSGNLMETFKNITEIGKEDEIFPTGVSCPPVIVKSLKIGSN